MRAAPSIRVCWVATAVALASCSGRGAGRVRAYEERVDRVIAELDQLGFPVDRARLRVELKRRDEARADLDRQQDLLFGPSHFDGMLAVLRMFLPQSVATAADLRSATLDSLVEALEAYYQADRDALVFFDSPLVRLTGVDGLVAHELVHAWHDQQAGLDPFIAGNRTPLDRAHTARCLMEGLAEAVGEAVLLARDGRSLRDLDPELLDPTVGRLLGGEYAVLPYHEGMRFMHARFVAGGWPAVRAALQAPPPSSEQVLHPEKLGRDVPTQVTLPDWPGPPGAELIHEDTLGEMAILLLLLEQGHGRGAAELGATGWDGDRLRVWRTPGGGLAVAWRSVWDREEDAHLFLDSFGRSPPVIPWRRGRVVDLAWADDPALAIRLHQALVALPADFPPVADDAATTAAAESAWLREQARDPVVAGGRWVHPRHGLSLPIPDGWTVEDVRGASVLLARRTASFADNVTVTAMPALHRGGIEGLRAQLDRELAAMAGGLEVLGIAPVTVDGVDGFRLDYQGGFAEGDPPVRIAALVVPRGAVVVTVAFTTEVDRWASVRAVAESVLGGITLRRP